MPAAVGVLQGWPLCRGAERAAGPCGLCLGLSVQHKQKHVIPGHSSNTSQSFSAPSLFFSLLFLQNQASLRWV